MRAAYLVQYNIGANMFFLLFAYNIPKYNIYFLIHLTNNYCY